MTVLEYYQKRSSVLGLNFSTQALTDFIEVSGLATGDTMDDKDEYDAFYIDIVKGLLIQPQSISEGQYSISYDKKALMDWYLMEARRLGVSPGIGEVRDMSYLA